MDSRVGRLLVAPVIAMCAAVGCSSATEGALGPSEGAPSARPLIAYGHSYLSAPDTYAGIAAAELGRPLDARAIPGATLAQVEDLIGRTWYSGDLVVLDATINDVLARTSTAKFEMELNQTLDMLCATAGRVVVVLPVATRAPHPGADPAVLAAYADSIRRAAAHHGPVRLADPAGWDPAVDLGPDGVHPNAAGRDVLARAVVAAAR